MEARKRSPTPISKTPSSRIKKSRAEPPPSPIHQLRIDSQEDAALKRSQSQGSLKSGEESPTASNVVLPPLEPAAGTPNSAKSNVNENAESGIILQKAAATGELAELDSQQDGRGRSNAVHTDKTTYGSSPKSKFFTGLTWTVYAGMGTAIGIGIWQACEHHWLALGICGGSLFIGLGWAIYVCCSSKFQRGDNCCLKMKL